MRTILDLPVGVSSIDEMTVQTKVSARAKTSMPSKPDKYGVRIYAVVGQDSLYALCHPTLHSINLTLERFFTRMRVNEVQQG
eukprot:jgi/Phyca11/132959/e_gw1.280.5.1